MYIFAAKKPSKKIVIHVHAIHNFKYSHTDIIMVKLETFICILQYIVLINT